MPSHLLCGYTGIAIELVCVRDASALLGWLTWLKKNQIRDGAYPTYLPTYLKQPYLPHKGSSEGDDVGGQKAGRSLIIRGSEFKGWVGVLDVSGSEYSI